MNVEIIISTALTLIALIVIVIIICVKAGALLLKLASKKYTYKTVIAKAVSKTYQIRGSERATRTNYYISFEFPCGNRYNFPVDLGSFNTILEDENGILTYKQKGQYMYYVSFQR